MSVFLTMYQYLFANGRKETVGNCFFYLSLQIIRLKTESFGFSTFVLQLPMLF